MSLPEQSLNQPKHLHVACAIIERNGLILAAQRSATMSMPLKWEFPGGKIRGDETPIECLQRELWEELEVKVDVLRAIPPASHRYPSFIVTLHPFICRLAGGEPCNNEHAALRWLPPAELSTLDWAEADLPIIAAYCRAPCHGDPV
ncbi:(deoxy)nucleoside triphosphate pyrophosphohydrolase [Desulfurivibrio sp. C05AmB]|uniref:(deoxy)nucleoside triphosphate pyrophosphohydrolase n=1 Tax=Desulfurivibrio sp. C05AmB TaxID=3374371 RepID=UPI00376EE874